MNKNIRNNFLLKIIYHFIFLIFLMNKYIKSINLETYKDISDYQHISFYLQNVSHYSIFKYNGKRKESNLILQLNTTSSYFPINIYFYNNNEIKYNETSGEFEDYSKFYNQTKFKENEEFEFEFESDTKDCYIVFSLSISNQSYSGIFTVFQMPVDILLNDIMTNNSNFYFLYGNNYTTKNFEPKYIFRIDSNKLYNNENKEIYIHCLSKSLDSKSITIKDNDDLILFENKTNNLDYYLNITKKNIYNIELIGLFNDSNSFSVFFEILYNYKDKIEFIGDNKYVCKYILGESTYYFYDYINTTKNQLENSLFYISYHSSLENMFKVEYFTVYNYTSRNKFIADELYEIALNGNYTQMEYKKDINNIIYYKYHDEYNKINDNIVIFRMKPYYSKSLNLNLFCLKKLPLIEINSDFFEIKFNSNFILDNVGYYYLSYKNTQYNDSFSNIILFGTDKNSFELYEGLYDIVDDNENENRPISNKDKFIILNRTYQPYTIKIINFEKFNFTFQLFVTSFKNSLFYLNENDKNKEINMNNSIKEFYLININRNDEIFILEPRVIYGHFTTKYFDLDSTGNEPYLNIKDIFSNDYNLEIIYNSKLSKSSLELIKIINNDFNSDISYEGVIYINRYNLSENINKGILTPFFLEKNEKISSKFITNYNNQTLDYIIKYDPNYPELLEENYIKVYLDKEIVTLNKKNNIVKGKINNATNEKTIIQFENLSNKYSFLIWIKFYIAEEEEKKYSKFSLSSEYYNDKINNNGYYIFSLDWNNILNNQKLYGNKIIPKDFHCNIMGDSKIDLTKGNYYQIITENNNSDFYLYNSNDTSITYKLNESYSHNFFQTRIDIPKMNQLLNKNKILHTVLFPQSSISSTQLSFYINYMYQEELEPNSLLLLNFSKNIYSLNINISKPKQSNSNIFFQAICCKNEETPEISLLYSKKGDTNYKKKDYSFQKEAKNIFYYMIKLKDTDDTNYLFEIFYPQNLFFQYYYFDDNKNIDNNINKIFNDYSYYNINIEKLGEELIVSFDSFELNTSTNYSLLIRNELDEKIINECQFLSLLSSYKSKDLLIYSSIDNGMNQRVKININITEYGNYEVYIFAHTLNNIGRYKLLGSKSYSFIINDGSQNGSSIFVIFLIISNIILILLIIIIVICYCYKKQKKDNLMNSSNENNSNIKESLLSTHSSDNNISNKIEKFDKPSSNESIDNINNEKDNNINNSISIIQESNFNILNKDAAIISGSINDVGENNDKNNGPNNNNENTLEGNNDIDNKNLDEENSEGAAPAFNFVKTENPEDNKIDNIFDDRNNVKDEQKDDDSIKKIFVNTDTTKG